MEQTQEYHIYAGTKLERLALRLAKRGFAATVHATAADAVQWFLGQLPEHATIGYGGSRSVEQLGLLPLLRESSHTLLDRSRPGLSKEEKGEIERKAFFADVFLASANAISEDGSIVNIDMWGNRTAAIEFGPKKVFLFVGRNKLCENVETAISRARNQAAVLNSIRFGKKNPCVLDGRCHDCASPERICAVLSIVSRSAHEGRISVVLINEELGF